MARERKAPAQDPVRGRPGDGSGAAVVHRAGNHGKLSDSLLRRVVIEGVTPEVDEGRFPAKATLGEDVIVEADIFTDGTDMISADLMFRRAKDAEWKAVPMQPLANDRWRGRLPVDQLGVYVYTIEAWIDPFLTWRRDLQRWLEAGQKVPMEFQIGAALVRAAAERAPGSNRGALLEAARRLVSGGRQSSRARVALDGQLQDLMRAYAGRTHSTRYQREVTVQVDPAQARFSTWYEMFPRSRWSFPGADGRKSSAVAKGSGPEDAAAPQQATFRDVEARLRYVSAMGFDILYLPPVHPIGRTHRKGPNNAPAAKPGDPGSPWAIGSEEGGHKAVDPALGTLEDFRRIVAVAREEYGIEVALDIAYQCSPDHPYVREYPQWFRHPPDGSIRHAENPPKKYEDIYPFDFDTEDWRSLWQELKSIVDFWIDQGVRIFRVDNPHTKPFAFWEWTLGEIRRKHPEVIFLAEAFTRPRVMYRLAKLGFSQSYTYFAWRNHKAELTEYLTELTTPPVSSFFRPNFWPNTPDILTEALQHGGRPAFTSRLVLAATLSPSYGIYGPAFELMEHQPREPGSEEYLHSEKYAIRQWEAGPPGGLHEVIAIVNRARHENRALQSNRVLLFHDADNPQIIAYSKRTDDLSNIVLMVVNLDHQYTQSGWLEVSLDDWGIAAGEPYELHDVLTDAHYTWRGPRNYVSLDPNVMPAHVLVVHRRGKPREAPR